jgi:hypothetical protein
LFTALQSLVLRQLLPVFLSSWILCLACEPLEYREG